MPTRNVDGNKSNVFNCKTFYRSIHWVIVVLNDAEKENNGSDIMIAAEGAISALIKLKYIGLLNAILLLQIFARLGIISPMYAFYGTVAETLLGPYKFIDHYHYSRQELDLSAKQEEIILEDTKISFEVVFKKLNELGSSFERYNYDGKWC